MATWISLLRAVNLGSHNKLAMPALRDALEDAGFADVRTYVQSGNIVAASRQRSAAAVEKAVHGVLADAFGLNVDVLVRSPKQLAAVIRANPFAKAATADPKFVHCVFLERAPTAAAIKRVHGEDVGRDELRCKGAEIFVRYGDGSRNSRITPDRLAKWSGRAGTARNWRTVLALVELADD